MLTRRFVFEESETWVETSELVLRFAEECREVVNSLALPDADARSVALRNTEHMARSVVVITNVLAAGSRKPEAEVRALFGITSGPLQVAVDGLDKFTRLGLLTSVQFQTENLLSNLLRALGQRARGYDRIVLTVLGAAHWKSIERAATVMRVPAAMRNTLHNNGFHDNPSFVTQIHGFKFRFSEGRRFTQAGWGHICHALRAELRVIERLLHMPVIKRIESVPDRYGVWAESRE